jgi:hypothetical protein
MLLMVTSAFIQIAFLLISQSFICKILLISIVYLLFILRHAFSLLKVPHALSHFLFNSATDKREHTKNGGHFTANLEWQEEADLLVQQYDSYVYLTPFTLFL